MNDKEHKRYLEVFDKGSLRDIHRKLKSDYQVDLAIKVLAIINYGSYDKKFSTYDIASFLGVNQASITRWVKIWNEKGLDGLKSRNLLKKRERDLRKICEAMREQKGKEE